ncbi:hypothetical protein EIP91_008139 [Steccherinum ochraceum]|uniref:Uncharacterized protein n=1 Tax=Steccherinum ochraceum TaxID=92696 RepID=A0A4R0R5Z4_9APHY|nr:hypothetical protein EIP91_008139 [Steccherinum ochraceum]
MDNPLILPRLRLSRHSSPRMKHDNSATPIAGPSRLLHSDDFLNVPANDDDDDSQSTPRLSTLAKLASEKTNSPIHPNSPGLPADTPAARLRALLARVPNNTPPASSRTYRAPSPSDLDSDFESVNPSPEAPSIARESLKSLFSHALRDPGDTPLKGKGRQRRNSVDASPNVDRTVERERAYNRGKRASMSDEEAEKMSHGQRRDEPPPRLTGAAATFDALRERLAHSTSSTTSSLSKPPTPPPDHGDASSSGSEEPMDMSEDTTTTTTNVLKQFNGDISTPPDATSTPMRSMQIPAQMQSQSNLLEQDSEMQRAMRDLDSYDEESQSLQQRKLVFPPGREQTPHSRPTSWSSHSKSHSTHNLPLSVSRRTSAEYDSSSSRASSNMSNADCKPRPPHRNPPRPPPRTRTLLEVPLQSPNTFTLPPTTPERPRHQHSNSSPSSSALKKPDTPAYGHGRARRGSNASSVQSFDGGERGGGGGSRASSVSSNSEYRLLMKEAEEEKNKERERLWNMPAHAHARTRTSSSLGMNTNSPSSADRIRTYSTPARPDSAQGYLSPVHSLSRKHSISSLSSSSRASSPAQSHSPAAIREKEKDPVVHVRERNWNSPHPKWKPEPRRSVSPMPPADAEGPSGRARNGSVSASRGGVGVKVKARRSLDVLSSPSSSLGVVNKSSPPARDKGKGRESDVSKRSSSSLLKSPSFSSSSSSKPPASASADRPKSPQPPPPPPEPEPEPPSSPSKSKVPNFKSRFGWSFPHDRAPLPPLEHDPDDDPEARAPSPVRLLAREGSRIPTATSSGFVASSGNGEGGVNGAGTTQIQKKKGHRRSPTEFSEAVGRVPPRVQAYEEGEGEVELLPVPIERAGDQESNTSSSPSHATPLAKPVVLPEDSPPRAPQITLNGDASPSRYRFATPDSPPLSPPPTSISNGIHGLLQTPPRKPVPNTPKLEFQTPSPPRGMPALPGPPSSSETEEEDEDRTPVNRSNDVLLGANLSNMKTPKPPGAWATPARDRDILALSRPNSTPPFRTPSPLANANGVRAATMSRAESLSLPTPAPPGAWLNTPAAAANSARRKSILKVRFDVDPGELSSDMSMMESTPPPASRMKAAPPPLPSPDLPRILPKTASDTEATSSSAPDDGEGGGEKVRRKGSPPKAPLVRLVDAFGREVVEGDDVPSSPPSPPQQNGSAVHRADPPPAVPKQPVTPRSRSLIRIVDAMGLKTTHLDPHPDFDFDPTMTHNEALARVRTTIADLAVDLDEVDRSYEDLALDENRLGALEDASRAARSARKRIEDSLKFVKTAEEDLKARFAGKGVRRETRYLPSVQSQSGVSWARVNTWTVCIFLVIQLLLMAFMYRYSHVQARKMFLTTYFDGFNVDLYLHLAQPGALRRSLFPFTFTWTPSSVSQAESWSGAASEFWGNITSSAEDLRERVWEMWARPGDFNLLSWESWPPT